MEKFDLTALKNIIQELRNSVPQKRLKYYNLKSVENFIHYFNKIKDVNRRKLIYKHLFDYLDEVKSIELLDRLTSLRLFNKYFGPIQKIYWRHGFVSYPGHDIMIIFLVIFGLISYFASSVAVSLFLFFIYVAYCFRLIRKTMKRKIYGHTY